MARLTRTLALTLGLTLLSGLAATEKSQLGEAPEAIGIPLLDRVPTIEEFLDMAPPPDLARGMGRATDFIQRNPRDGEPATVRTEVYFSYDRKNVYFVFLAFDPDPSLVRARMTPRERTFGDDTVQVMLDTFDDQRRAFTFRCNPFGIQSDAYYTEGQGFDFAWDGLWESTGRITEKGFVVLMSIPFKSLRFSPREDQSWRVIFGRGKPAINETSFWPRVSSRIEGRLNQSAPVTGIEGISGGRNIRLIPYGVFRSFRLLDEDTASFVSDTEVDGGLDFKKVFQDRLVLDVAVNPDFSQVESDRPQITSNRRFEVFFPERRPFFLENAQFFETPINLVFTRRIADPQIGGRLTGKMGPYAIGIIAMDDQSPGRRVAEDDPLAGSRAFFGIFRVSRDIFEQSSIGLLYTDRTLRNSSNRVFGIDGRFRLNDNWVADFQAVTSSTTTDDGEEFGGPAYQFELERSGRQFRYEASYRDISEGFVTKTGFVSRTGIRRTRQEVEYDFRPEGNFLISYGPRIEVSGVWDRSGTRLDAEFQPQFRFNFIGRSRLNFFYTTGRERLRPEDDGSLPESRDYSFNRRGFFLSSSYFSKLTFRGSLRLGTAVNFVPPEGQPPELADLLSANVNLTFRPMTPLRIDGTFIKSRLSDRGSKSRIFDDQILRATLSWQFNRELSLRVIVQHESTETDPFLTDLQRRKNLNADFLVSYQVNPWTVLYVGYNSNYQNLELRPGMDSDEIHRTQESLLNDGRQFFVKFSYLFQY